MGARAVSAGSKVDQELLSGSVTSFVNTTKETVIKIPATFEHLITGSYDSMYGTDETVLYCMVLGAGVLDGVEW